MSGFTLAPSAARDLDSIWHYLAVEQSRRQTATRQIQRLSDTFAALGLHPELGQVRDDLAEGIRAFICRPYVVLYRIEVRGPCILQIVHGSRELRDLFRD
ncbi:MAG: type II toxin-antitoxin system RelE/ParE family toxin [Pirellulales bacterium]